MRVPLTWLREYCDPALDVQQIEQRLTLTGTKVEAIHHHGVCGGEGFVVGHVLDVQPHPDADRLRVCTVDIGETENGGPAQIVCGAPNVSVGQTVAVVLPGGVMPDGTKIKGAKLRGVASEGMILAESELEIGPGGEEGILVLDGLQLDAEFAPGTPLADLLPIETDVLELEITPNRPDCLGVYGVARELHAATGAALAPEPWGEDPGSDGPVESAEIVVECPDLCPRFTARVFENVTIAPSPPWLKARLMAAGQRPINNVVDVTNYAMLLSGQPLHAFDLDRVAGAKLTVRRAHDGEQVQTLDGQTRTLDARMVLIEDAEGPTSIAGLMGGARSEVAPETTRVLMEVATWDGPSIHRASWQLGLRSEASSRFEKGLQPEQCLHAQAIATQLMVECCGARPLTGTIDVGEPSAPLQVLRLREARVQAILGVPVPAERQAEILRALDFDCKPAQASEPDAADAAGLDVTVPALRRQDVTREVDLIEEVARIDGLEGLPATLPARRGAAGALTHAQRVRREAEDAMVGRGLSEVVGWSFAEPALLDRLQLPAEHAMRRVVRLENPLSDAQSIMRPTLLGSLLDAARYNVARNGPDVAIFESGTVYRALDPASDGGEDTGPRIKRRGAEEHHALGALLTGALAPRSWHGGAPARADFFAAKGLLAALLDRFHVHWSVREEQWPFLHPGRSAAVLARDPAGQPLQLGFLGEVHPLVAEAWGLERTAAFAIDLGKLAAAAPEALAFRAFGSVPTLRQDIAVTLPERVPARDVLHALRKAAGEILAGAEIFDVYTGSQVGEGRRSLALALSFRADERTLTDEDVAPVRERIVAALGELGGELRG
ncbi:MAG TPA: phenylalanine--tRNA ligase subunit beta [Solirubrobacteraceae bacterium]|jgi:phenylalanyl-tRNA synthetase beta chain|nr:phenylalanine--tRNA ligase subunit beta [Solirubrobacteraceae bacterium]